MTKRLLVLISAAALLLGLPVGINSASAAQRGITCSLAGKATFKPGLGLSAQDTKYSFSGTLSSCQSTDSTATAATISAKGSGSLQCGGGSSSGVATIKWSNGKTTTVSFSTTDAAALVAVNAKVTKSTEEAIGAGDQSLGLLVFQADAPSCNSAAGVTTATFTGQIGGGSPS